MFKEFWPSGPRLLLPWIIGAYEALLLARLLARLFAARLDNPAIQFLYRVTEPSAQLLSFMNAAQPRFGAALELSTLTLAIVVPIVGYLLWFLLFSARTMATTSSTSTSS